MSYEERKLALLYKEKKGKEWTSKDINKLIEYSNIDINHANYIIEALNTYKLDIHLFLERTLDFHNLQLRKSQYKFDEVKFKTALSMYMDKADNNHLIDIYKYSGIPENFINIILKEFKFSNNFDLILQSFEKYKLMYEQCLLPSAIVKRLIDKHRFITAIIRGCPSFVIKYNLVKYLNKNFASNINIITIDLFSRKYDAIMYDIHDMYNMVLHKF